MSQLYPLWLDCLIISGILIGVLMLLAVFVVGGGN